MKIALTPEQLNTIKAFLDRFPDSEALSEREYVLDLYDLAQPVSIDLTLQRDGLFIEGAAELLFNDEMDGWYIGNRIEDCDAILSALREAGAFDK